LIYNQVNFSERRLVKEKGKVTFYVSQGRAKGLDVRSNLVGLDTNRQLLLFFDLNT